MTLIIWCDYIFYFDYSSSHFIFYKFIQFKSLSKKMIILFLDYLFFLAT